MSLNNYREVKGRRRMPRPVPLMLVLLSLGLLALVSLAGSTLSLPNILVLVVQLVWLIVTGVYVLRYALKVMHDLRDDRRSLGETQWRVARYFTASAMVLAVFCLLLSLILIVNLLAPEVAFGMSLMAYILGASGVGLAIFAVAGLVQARNERR